MNRDSRYLFVYGTLRRGANNRFAKLLSAHATFLGPAKARGRLYRLDRYPGMTRAESEGDWVVGELYRLHRSADLLPTLDDYEGCGTRHRAPRQFERRMSPVTLENGRTIHAWTYFYCRDTAGKPRIASGDYFQPGFRP